MNPFAEDWRRHLHYGFSATEVDPLRDALGKNYLVNRNYEQELVRAAKSASHQSRTQ